MIPPSYTHPELHNALVVLVGPSGAGKSTLASTWPASQVLSLDTLRGQVSDDPGCQEATADAVEALHLLLDRRMARRLTTVIDATSIDRQSRAPLVAAAKRHNMPAVAIVVETPVSVCLERQDSRPANRRVPENVVRAQHQAAVRSHPTLATEGFGHVLIAGNLHRLEPYLRSLSEAHTAELDPGDNGDLAHLALPHRFFGPQILPMWQWKPGSTLAGGDRVAEIRLGQQHLTLALRTNVDGEGDIGFDVMLPCPFAPGCDGPAWAPAHSITCLHQALTGELDDSDDLVCTIHGEYDTTDQETNGHTHHSTTPETHTGITAERELEAVRG